MCNAHIDTVAEGDGWTRDPGGTVVGDRFYGLGSADTKASTVAALLASACVRSMGIEPRMPIELHSVIDEEPGGNGTLSLVREIVAGDLRRPQLVVVMEPSRLDVLSGHRGMLWHRIECLGVQTHGSGTDGVNAIEIAAEVVLRLRALNQDFSRWSEGTYPAPRVNVGIVAGGHEVYTTPGRATLDVSARYAPGQRDAVEQAVLAAVRGKGTSGPADIRAMLWSDFDAAETDERDPAVASVLAAIQDLRPDAEVSRLMGTCDMRHYARELGVPTVIFGPGDLAVAHAADEYVDLDEVFTAARALASLSVRGIGSGGRHEPEGD